MIPEKFAKEKIGRREGRFRGKKNRKILQLKKIMGKERPMHGVCFMGT